MNEILSAIQQHLQRQLKLTQLDYYQIIGLEPFCSDRSKIESALQAARDTLLKSEQSDSANTAQASLQLVNKLLRQAQAILLDPSKKTAYDSQLAKLFESQKKQKSLGDPETTTASPSIRSLAKPSAKTAAALAAPAAAPNAAQLLPAGDPMQPYTTPLASSSAVANPAYTAAQSGSSAPLYLSPDKRRAELSELFPSLMLMSLQAEEAQEQAPAWLVAADRKPSKATATATPNDASAEPPTKTVDLVDQLRKRRRRRNLLAVGGMILSALGLLGFASYRFVSNRLQVAQQEKKAPRDNAQLDAATDGNSAPTATPKAPDLVIAPNKKGRNSKPNSDQKLPELPSVQRDTSSPAPAVPTMPEAMPEAMPEKSPTPPANPEPAANPTPPANPEPAANPTPAPSPEPAPNPEPAASAESAPWKTAMTQAKEALAKGDLKAFESLMAGLIDKAVSKQGKEQTARLDQAGQLYKIYVESIEESKKKAKGASSLKVGPTQVAIVESTPEKLILREAGGNKTYAWDKLPFGIAAAISDLSLSESSPVDQAARAVYFSLSPFYQEAAKANSLVTKRIDGWFERSVGKDSVRKDLKQFLTDKYE